VRGRAVGNVVDEEAGVVDVVGVKDDAFGVGEDKLQSVLVS